MEIFIISLVAFTVSILTFFSGFGLGTLLAPVMMLFFPVELSIALTGVVHFFNNIFKLFLVGKNADKKVLIRFGIPALIFAFLGSYLLMHLVTFEPIYSYRVWEHDFHIYPIKLIIALLLMVFGAMELIPYFKKLEFSSNKLPLGGALSGFFGGLSGNQGALRSAFLIKSGLSKEAFIGTSVVVSAFVDFTRLSVYYGKLAEVNWADQMNLILIATLSAITGAYLGNFLLKKITLHFIQNLVAVLLLVIAFALGLGML
jgi:uncharacterized membrane protein YfcA